MASSTNRPTLAELERLAVLAKLPDDAILCTADAALYRGVGVSTWERERVRGIRDLPPAIRITDRTLGYRKSDLDAWLKARKEGEARAKEAQARAEAKTAVKAEAKASKAKAV
jgi:hypothetical protein